MSLMNMARDKAFGGVVKASLEICDDNGKALESITCGFNPTEYSISNSTRYIQRTGFGEAFNINDLTIARGMPSKLSVTVLFDEEINLNGVIFQAIKYHGRHGKPKTIKEVTEYLLKLLHFDNETHTTPYFAFVWGSVRFLGKMESITVQFVQFDKQGNPTRAKVAMSITGEDTYFSTQTLQKPKESPDRTKYRMLKQQDELWMLASKEYGDPMQWREIAQENAILNPRLIDHTRVLKVPSI